MPRVEFESLNPQIGKIWLSHPETLNAMSEEMAADFLALVQTLKSDTALRCLILSGKGKAFSAGGDLAMLERKTLLSHQENHRLMMEFYNSFLSILTLQVPLIAAIQGAAVGAGLCIASACDIRICADNARLGFTFVKLGLHPGMGGTFYLPRVVGDSAARELLLTGRIIDAAEALRIGLVSKIVPGEHLQQSAESIAEEIVANGPLAVRQLVATLRPSASDMERALAHEAECQSQNYASAEFKEGIRAIQEKRNPKFSSL